MAEEGSDVEDTAGARFEGQATAGLDDWSHEIVLMHRGATASRQRGIRGALGQVDDEVVQGRDRPGDLVVELMAERDRAEPDAANAGGPERIS